MMDWYKLLSSKRFGQESIEPVSASRSPFHKDQDRIVFSSAFRRLQDKTQVHSMTDSDYVRTRLTHSMEVASVGRSLGANAGQVVIDRHLKGSNYTAAEFGHIVSAACLAHDIGNPPFGHSGENAIDEYFTSGKGAQREKVGVLFLTTLFFGLVHGLGFAREFQMLLGDTDNKLILLLEFALGIELSQVIIVFVVLFLGYIVQTIFRFTKRDWIMVISAIVVGLVIPMILNSDFLA